MFVSLCCAMFFAYYLARKDFDPIAQLINVCRHISNGDYNRRVVSLPKNEIGELGQVINELSSDILHKITRLSLEKTQLKTILAVMNETVSLDHNGDIIFCNRTAYKLLGCKFSDARGMHISKVDGFNVLNKISKKF